MRSHLLSRWTWLLLVLAAIPIAVPETSWPVGLLCRVERAEDSESSEEELLDEGSLDEATLLGRHRLRLVRRRVARREWLAERSLPQRLLFSQTSFFSANFLLPAEFAAHNGFGGPLRC